MKESKNVIKRENNIKAVKIKESREKKDIPRAEKERNIRGRRTQIK